MTDSLLPSVLPFVYNGLQDVDDDVRAVAASALVPVANNVVKVLPHQVVLSFILTLLGDLFISTNFPYFLHFGLKNCVPLIQVEFLKIRSLVNI